jgi:hypothetical protein
MDVPQDGNTVGEIVTRGNIVMQGYFQDPDTTARAFEGGYFHTGDLAVWHADGSVQIRDRSKDIIISGGEVCALPSTFPSPLIGEQSECIVDCDRTRSIFSFPRSRVVNVCFDCRIG